MSETGTYFQFPLPALAFGDDLTQRIDHIISYCVADMGDKVKAKSDDAKWRTHVQVSESRTENLNQQGYSNKYERLVVGCVHLGVNPGWFPNTDERAKALRSFCNEFAGRNGKQSFVRIGKSLAFDVRDSQALSAREFAVLCAVNNSLGGWKMARVTREMIRTRSLGYINAAVMAREIASRSDGAVPLTDGEIRWALDNLERIKFFRRCHPTPRRTYFTTQLTQDELEGAVVRSLTARAEFKANKAERTEAVAQKIKERIARARPNKEATPATTIIATQENSATETRTTTIIAEPSSQPVNAPCATSEQPQALPQEQPHNNHLHSSASHKSSSHKSAPSKEFSDECSLELEPKSEAAVAAHFERLFPAAVTTRWTTSPLRIGSGLTNHGGNRQQHGSATAWTQSEGGRRSHRG
jgi:hypothetical protein